MTVYLFIYRSTLLVLHIYIYGYVIAYAGPNIFVVFVCHVRSNYISWRINETPLREMREINNMHLIILFLRSMCAVAQATEMRHTECVSYFRTSTDWVRRWRNKKTHCLPLRPKMDVRMSFFPSLDLSHFYCQGMCGSSISVIMYAGTATEQHQKLISIVNACKLPYASCEGDVKNHRKLFIEHTLQ